MKRFKSILKTTMSWGRGRGAPRERPRKNDETAAPIANRKSQIANAYSPWALAALILLAAQSPAWAHAFLDHSKPKVGSTVKSSPSEVKIWFTQALEPAFSVIEVKNALGKRVTKKKARVDKKNGKLLELPLPKLPPGTYKVIWHVVSVDTHRTQGHFEFTIK
jgi:copper resistance protein C